MGARTAKAAKAQARMIMKAKAKISALNAKGVKQASHAEYRAMTPAQRVQAARSGRLTAVTTAAKARMRDPRR